jgi:hypothetical protein
MRVSARSVGAAALLTIAAALAGCDKAAPALPADITPATVHDLVTEPSGQQFLFTISDYAWPDGGARPASLFHWIPTNAESSDPAAAKQAAETAHPVATMLAAHRSDLLNLPSGWLGRDRTTVGNRNPILVREYAAALIPFQRALVCDAQDAPGFGMLADSCDAALAQARQVIAVLRTDSSAAQTFTDAAYRTIDDYFAAFTDGGPSNSANPSAAAPRYAGSLLGLLAANADNVAVKPRSPDEELINARYVVVSGLLKNDSNSDIPQSYFAQNKLMGPQQIREKLGYSGLQEYNSSLTTYLINHGNIEALISSPFRTAYEAAGG